MNIRLWLASAAGAASLAAVLAFTPTSASAQQPTASAPMVAMHGPNRGQGGTGTGTCSGTNFVDTNGDGVCDNAGTGTGVNFVDANGDGVCDNVGTGTGRGQGSGRGRS